MVDNDVNHYPSTSCFDTECYANYWLCAFDSGEYFELYDDHPLDIAGLSQALATYTLISFNGINYDLPMIALALAGFTNNQLKQASDALIVGGIKHWELLKQWGVKPLELDHIDMIEVAPGAGSLKAYGGKMQTQTLQDLPYQPDIITDWPQRVLLREYCRNDLKVTRELYDTFPAQLKLRAEMGAEYRLELRSKSDAQIAESVMRSLLPFTPTIPKYAPGTTFNYRAPKWLSFVNLDVLALLTSSNFTISESGGVTMPDELSNALIKIGSSSYKMGIGGLHSTESNAVHIADEYTVLRDHDVASYYPSLILCTGISPLQLGDNFRRIYEGWYDRRLAAKHAGDKKTANTLKTLLNGSFGKLGSRYSIFYAPTEMIQVTITGQLALLMLIEMMELCGIPVVSANTDGIVLKCPRHLEWLANDVIAAWEARTSFVTEETRYKLVHGRDVNSYVAITESDEVKLKGCFAPPAPGASGWPNPTAEICTNALIAYLKDKTPIEQTIRACTDIKKFVVVRSVTGGGSFNSRPIIPKKTSKRRMLALCEQYGFSDYPALLAWANGSLDYLGKVVRWYYGGRHGHIQYKSGNLVPCSEGCEPIMTLPDELPLDINYDKYIMLTEASIII